MQVFYFRADQLKKYFYCPTTFYIILGSNKKIKDIIMQLTENELILKAQKGDAMAFEELIYRYDKMVLRLALKYAADPDDAKDIYQEVFIRVYRNLPGFQFKSEFSTWLFRITTNMCITYKRKHNKINQVAIDMDDETSFISEIAGNEDLSPEVITEKSEFESKINKALESLSPNQKMSFLLKHYEGYKIKEIAEMMNCKEGTIKKYLFDAVRKLQLKLAGAF